MAIKTLTLALIFACAVSAAPDGRIVGGTPTTIQEFPYIVALVYRYPGAGITVQRCVGALVSSWHVLSSAFCFSGANLMNLEIRAGSTNSMSGGSVVTVREVIKHPDFQRSPRTADIAVVVLSSPLGISSNINILYLPPQNTYIPDGQIVKVVSWGFESEAGPQLENLKRINLRKVPLLDCAAAYEGDDSVLIGDPVICAAEEGPVGTCMGDSGAPMVINQVAVGIASYYSECGSDDKPDVFTRIDRYTDWIMSVATAPSAAGGTPVRVQSVTY